MTFPVTGSIFRTGEAGPSDPYNRLSSARLYSSALTSCRVLLRRNRLRGFREPRNDDRAPIARLSEFDCRHLDVFTHRGIQTCAINARLCQLVRYELAGNSTARFGFFKKRCVVSRIARSQEPKEKRRKRERELENPHGAIRLKAVAAALEHRRRRDNSSRQKNKSPKERPSGKR